MNKILAAAIERLRNEPVLVVAFVSALLVLLVTVGIPVPPDLEKALTLLIMATSALIARRKVKPTRKSE